MTCWRLLCLGYYSLERTLGSEIYVNRFSISAPVHTLQTEGQQSTRFHAAQDSKHSLHSHKTNNRQISRCRGLAASCRYIAIVQSVRHTNKAADFTVPGTRSLLLNGFWTN
jgi:hypothetical protein